MPKKEDLIKIIFPILLFICLPLIAQAEQINNFETEIKINENSELEISELIVYDFGSVEKHGIYRDIPYKYKVRGGNYQLRLSDISVKDASGNEYKFEVSNHKDNKRIKIGNPDKTVTGVQTYLIKYRVKRAINFFEGHDELYWNVTGNGWVSPIAQTKTSVIFPGGANTDELQVACYAGPSGSVNNCVSTRLNYTAEKIADGVVFSDDFLRPYEGVTLVVGLPKGLIEKPAWHEALFDMLKDNWILILPFLVFAFLFQNWKKYGKDPAGRGTIITQFDAPDNLSPAEVGAIFDEIAHNKDVSAEIINLAVAGYLRILKIQDKGIFKKSDYEIVKIKNDNAKLGEHQKLLLKALFGDKEKIKLSDLKEKFYRDLKKINDSIYKNLVNKGYFLENPNSVRINYGVLGVVVILFSFFSISIFGFLGMASIIVSGILIAVFGFFMPKKSKKGVLAREHILGLKSYLDVAEKDRIDFHNSPLRQGFAGQGSKKDPQVFEKLLPFAMVLGLEKAWAKQFEEIYRENPSWYSDPNMGHFSALGFASSLGSFQAQANSTLASSPSSAASGGSGFSGGGSGGGFGGGGGGSW